MTTTNNIKKGSIVQSLHSGKNYRVKSINNPYHGDNVYYCELDEPFKYDYVILKEDAIDNINWKLIK